MISVALAGANRKLSGRTRIPARCTLKARFGFTTALIAGSIQSESPEKV